ncbi:MAG: dihydrodipicolinate synthase family protein, partial [Thermoguttaceae bacterium]|nr:dihydrodipicolinate synthase family protein [Thermoguttaceae bacterium]
MTPESFSQNASARDQGSSARGDFGGAFASLPRREFLAASAAMMSACVLAAPASAGAPATPQAPMRLPSAATKENARKIVVGPLIPVITNLQKDLRVDLGAIRANVKYVIEHGMVTGKGCLLAVGAGGDFDVLSLDERKAVAQAIVEAADGRVPVVVGVQDSNPRVSLEMAQLAQSLGAYGVQVSPTYYHTPSDDDFVRFIRWLHDHTAKIGLMVYNTWWQGYNIPHGVMDQLVELERSAGMRPLDRHDPLQ